MKTISTYGNCLRMPLIILFFLILSSCSTTEDSPNVSQPIQASLDPNRPEDALIIAVSKIREKLNIKLNTLTKAEKKAYLNKLSLISQSATEQNNREFYSMMGFADEKEVQNIFTEIRSKYNFMIQSNKTFPGMSTVQKEKFIFNRLKGKTSVYHSSFRTTDAAGDEEAVSDALSKCKAEWDEAIGKIEASTIIAELACLGLWELTPVAVLVCIAAVEKYDYHERQTIEREFNECVAEAMNAKEKK